MTCEGCGLPGATVKRWYPSSWGSRPVALHASPACALAARDRLGGREFLSEQNARMLKGMLEYVGWLRREWHSTKGTTT